jgi:hypothetical protein
VILCPGPNEEVETVNWIYQQFVVDRLNEQAIADELNARGITRDSGEPWTRGTVHQVLINEKYIGDNVWNRFSTKLKGRKVRNDPSSWVRANGVFEPIVDRNLFDTARAIIEHRSRHFTNEEMLKSLLPLLTKYGYLSGLIIDEAEECPSSTVYVKRFGSLLRAYALVGFHPDRDYSYLEINHRLRELHPSIITEVLQQIRDHGGRVEIDPVTHLVKVNDEFSVSLVLSRCLTLPSGSRRWNIRFDLTLLPDITIAVRMAADNQSILDYYIFPSIDLSALSIRLAEQNASTLDIYRFGDLQPLFQMSRRLSLQEWAS